MQDIETTKLKAKRRTDWKKFRRLGLQIGLSTAESFLKGAAVAGGAAVVTKILTTTPKKDADILSFPSRRQG